MSLKIELIKDEYIDRRKYDQCILNSFNGVIYAFSGYLDRACKRWELLVANDYEIVMPLPVKGWGRISRVYSPMWVHQLGVFSSKMLTPEIINAFMEAIPYSLVHLELNNKNRLDHNNRSHKEVLFQALDLIGSPESIKKNLSVKSIALLMRAHEEKVYVMRGISIDEYVRFKKENHPNFANKPEMEQFFRLLYFLGASLFSDLYASYNKQNQLIATAFVSKSNRKLFLLDTNQSPEGELSGGIMAILNFIIEKNAEKNLILEIPNFNHLLPDICATHSSVIQWKQGFSIFE